MENELKSLTAIMSSEQQQKIRYRLIRIMRRSRISISAIARDAGVMVITLHNFLVKEKNIKAHSTFFKIESYIEQKEKEFELPNL